jgi:hypothetical protein
MHVGTADGDSTRKKYSCSTAKEAGVSLAASVLRLEMHAE